MFSRLHGRFAGILERFSNDEEPRRFILAEYDAEDDEITTQLYDLGFLESGDFLRRESPKQLPISAETVFLFQFRNDPRRFSRKTGESMTIDEAWNRLSPRERQRYTAKAKKNEVHNITKLAEFNMRCWLSPSVENLSSLWPSMQAVSIDMERWQLTRLRFGALQRWNRYRSDYPGACGSHKTNVPERPFRIMDLPFELRREIFSLVLSRPYPIHQFPSDGSADALYGPVDVRLFAVSRQVFAEAVKIFYEVNTLSISTHPSSYLKAMPLFMRQSTGSEAPRPTNSIRRVHVSFRFVKGASTDTDAFRFLWKMFCEFLKTCRNLRTVEISARWLPFRAFDEAIHLQMDRLAEILMSSRCTVGATFSDTMTYEPFEYQGIPLLHDRCRARQIVCTMA